VAGEAEAHEPLAVERARHRFEDRDAARVVRDQVVVGAQGVEPEAVVGEDLGFC